MNYIQEAFKKLNELGSAKKEAKSLSANISETCEKGDEACEKVDETCKEGEDCKEGDEACKEECESCDEGLKDPIKYEGFTITATDDGKWLVEEWYEYYGSKEAAMEAIDKYLKGLGPKEQGEPKKD